MRIDERLRKPEPVFSVEFFPPRDQAGEDRLLETVEALRPLAPDFVSVTYGAAGSTRDGTVEMVERIRNEYGIEAMAHLSCVGETREGIVAILDRFKSAGVQNVLALRGDPPRGESTFAVTEGGLRSAADLTAFVAERYDFALGGACFPEVHPEAADLEADLAYLRRKVAAGARFLITQLFFDNRVYFEFVAAARRAGIDVPIIPGVIPIASFGQVQRICTLCDATIPPHLESAMSALGGDPEAEAALGIAYAARQCDELLARGAPGIHFYALNRAPGTRAVLSALRAARPWDVARDHGIAEALG